MDIYTLLKRDNAKLERLAGKLLDPATRAPEERTRLLAEMRAAFRAHERAEESSIFPLLLHDDVAHEEAVHAREEHRDAESLLDELAELPPADRRFKRKVQELLVLVRSHLSREEHRLIPRAAEIISDVDAYAFARQVEAERARGRGP